MWSNLKAVPQNAFGFIYIIEFEDGKKYIGKKNFFSVRKRNFGKKEIAKLKDKRLKKYEYVTKESNWKDYTSSNKDVNSRIKSGDKYTKTVLEIAYSKKELTFMEEYYCYTNFVLFNDCFYNDNIAGRFFTKDVEEWELIKK